MKFQRNRSMGRCATGGNEVHRAKFPCKTDPTGLMRNNQTILMSTFCSEQSIALVNFLSFF